MGILLRSALLVLAVFVCSRDLGAHTRLVFPPPRDDRAHKTGPCGDVPRTGAPLVLEAGQEVEVEWEEFIDHPGYYEIWFSPGGDTDFELLLGGHPDVAMPPGVSSNRYSATVTLPALPCEEGTLQVIQYMTEDPKRPRLYFSCADVRLVEPSPLSPFVRADTNADGRVDVSDGVQTFEFLFRGGPEPECEDAADSNDDGLLDISDGIHTLIWLFTGGSSPPGPGPESCGVDPTEDSLDCASFPPCEEN